MAKSGVAAAYLLRDPHFGLTRIHERYGKIVTLFAGPTRVTLLFGAEANEAVLARHADTMLWRDGVKAIMPLAGESAFGVCDGDLYKTLRGTIDPAFTRPELDGHMPIIWEEAQSLVEDLKPGSVIELQSTFQRTVRRIIVRCLLGEELGKQSDTIGASFAPGFAYMNTRRALFQRNIPGSAYRHVLRSRSVADSLIIAEVRRRRVGRDGRGRTTVLDLLTDEDVCLAGQPLSDGMVRDQAAELLAAGQETTSATLAWVFCQSGRDARVLTNLIEEARGLAPDDLLSSRTWATSVSYIRATLSETLRLYPPVGVTPRRVAEDFEVLGTSIPKGTFVLLSQFVTHRMRELWGANAAAFLPERWLPTSGVYEPVRRFSYFPFGLGPRRCIGPALAMRIMTVVLGTVLARVSLEVLPSVDARTGVITMSPSGGVPAKVVSVSEWGHRR